MIHWLSKQQSYLAKHQFITECLKQPFWSPTEKQYWRSHIEKKNIQKNNKEKYYIHCTEIDFFLIKNYLINYEASRSTSLILKQCKNFNLTLKFKTIGFSYLGTLECTSWPNDCIFHRTAYFKCFLIYLTSHLYQAAFITPALLKIRAPKLSKTSYTFTSSENSSGLLCLESVTRVTLNHTFVSPAWHYVAPFPIWHGIPQRLQQKKKIRKYLTKTPFHVNLFLFQLTPSGSSQFFLITPDMPLTCKQE